MVRVRVIPILLLNNGGLYKTEKFNKPKYVGDPINAVKIFNDKEVDELIFFDISASKKSIQPSFEVIKEIATECFMPLCYGGGVSDTETMKEILKIGVEKISINTAAVRKPHLIREASSYFGSSTIVVSIDVKKNILGKYSVYINGGEEKTQLDPVTWAKKVEELGAGEILINSIDKDGTLQGYDHTLIKQVANSVNIPVVAVGGASGIMDFKQAIHEDNASAVAAGAYFVFQGKHRAVLITYPTQKEIIELVKIK